ncbi:hypothetical protein I7I53_07949 [Histoplasma capsulatum var. duboisii H88]|uniref:Uncharacterized protein n=1 Tax=Ajellomyces capsulatus (strain H88) TaxID=544711 RepID=A0A8A1LE51_AJEC8|nr:hypothetical protein I7I53_07949 [Histoplasma capsulatum var. duboisii H88]
MAAKPRVLHTSWLLEAPKQASNWQPWFQSIIFIDKCAPDPSSTDQEMSFSFDPFLLQPFLVRDKNQLITLLQKSCNFPRNFPEKPSLNK